MKTCTKCFLEKPLTEFYKRSRSKDGHAARCVECVRAYKKQFYADNAERIKSDVKKYYADHSEERRAYTRDYYLTHREECLEKQSALRRNNADRIRARDKKRREDNLQAYLAREKSYREANYEKRREQSARWRLENPEKMRESRQNWKKNNPEKVLESARACGNRRRARKAQATVLDFTSEQLNCRLGYYGYMCYLCGGEADQIDHVKPLAAGGAHMLCNLRPACGRCNQRKNDTWPYPVGSKGAA